MSSTLQLGNSRPPTVAGPPRSPISWRCAIPAVLGAAVGLASWLTSLPMAVASVVVVLHLVLQRRVDVVCLWLGYMAPCVWPVVSAILAFDDTFPLVPAWSTGLCLPALVTAAWALSWVTPAASVGKRICSLTLPLALTALPPMGVVALQHPIYASSSLFPGLGWAGIGLTVTGWALIAVARRVHWSLVMGLASILVACAWWAHATEEPVSVGRPPNVLPIQTQRNPASSYAELVANTSDLAATIRESPQNYDLIVTPEGSVTKLTPGVATLLRDLLASNTGSTLLIGAAREGKGTRLENGALLVQGNRSRYIQQRQPIPFGLWRPWHEEHYGAIWDIDPTFQVNGKTLLLKVCGDELNLTFHLLDSFRYNPDGVVIIANYWWSEEAWHSDLANRHMRAWTRLFGMPSWRAMNRYR